MKTSQKTQIMRCVYLFALCGRVCVRACACVRVRVCMCVNASGGGGRGGDRKSERAYTSVCSVGSVFNACVRA